MTRKVFGLFSGTHLTIMFTAVMGVLLPGTVLAVDAFTNIAIEDPTTGVKAAVDNQHRLQVFNTISSYSQAPANFVKAFGDTNSNCYTLYTVPAGKALVIQSMTAYLHNSSTAGSDVEALLFSGANCSNLIAAAISDRLHETSVQTFGSGLAIPAGGSVYSYGYNNNGSLYIYGYLVPKGQVPEATIDAEANNGPEVSSTITKRSR